MRTFKFHLGEAFLFIFLTSLSSTFLLFQSCKEDKERDKSRAVEVEKNNSIEIITEAMDFQMADTIPSGWNTFVYKNLSPQTHFFIVDKYPEGKTSEDLEKFVAPVFDSAMKLIIEGETEAGYAEFAKFPEWYGEVVFVGGSGLLSPGQVGETTLNLKPGNYIIECYVKMSNGIFHSSMGMTKDIVVVEKNSGNEALNADIPVTISSTDGIVFNDSIPLGKHTFSVNFKDQITHEHFVGHDVHLVSLSETANLKDLEHWMNWANPTGLMDPAPSGITFLGGVNDMPADNTGYFTANLSPGTYALLSEVPNAKEKNMLKIFVVSE